MNKILLSCFLIVGFFASQIATAQKITFDHYHSQTEINDYLLAVADQHPEFASYQKIGQSEQGRDMALIILSKGNLENLPAIFLNGAHHGNEKSSTESILGLIDFLTTNRHEDSLTKIFNQYAIYLMPVVNPDGHAMNTRNDSRNFDLNRDYAYPGRGEAASFKTKEIQLIKELMDRVSFRAAVAFHSGMEGVLWPWCHTGDAPPDHDMFREVSKRYTNAMGMNFYSQSYDDYPTNGEFIDFAYMKYGTVAVTAEVSRQSNPPAARLGHYVGNAVAGTLNFMNSIYEIDQGLFEIDTEIDTSLFATN